jgi:integrase
VISPSVQLHCRNTKWKTDSLGMSHIDSGLPVASGNLLASGAARAAGFDMKVHPHMLRHSCGYKLANDGVDTRTTQSYLGHKSIQHIRPRSAWRFRDPAPLAAAERHARGAKPLIPRLVSSRVWVVRILEIP